MMRTMYVIVHADCGKLGCGRCWSHELVKMPSSSPEPVQCWCTRFQSRLRIVGGERQRCRKCLNAEKRAAHRR